MRNRPSNPRGLSPAWLLALGLLVLLLGGGATFAVLVATGLVNLAQTPLQREPSREGLVAFPVLGRPVAAYSRISRDDLADPKTGQLMVMWVKADQLDPLWERDLSNIVGRVVARDKSPSYIFTESDFLPRGTREGVVGGIPPGKRAMLVDAAAISGLRHLRPGDRFDLLASLPVNMQQLVPRVQWGLLQENIDERDQAIGTLQQQATVKVLAHYAAVISHHQEPGTGNKPGTHQVTIAVEPAEITPLTEAMAIKAGMVCVARSGHPDDPGATSHTPHHDPFKNMAFIENIRGNQRQLDVFVTASAHHDAAAAAAVRPSRGAVAASER